MMAEEKEKRIEIQPEPQETVENVNPPVKYKKNYYKNKTNETHELTPARELALEKARKKRSDNRKILQDKLKEYDILKTENMSLKQQIELLKQLQNVQKPTKKSKKKVIYVSDDDNDDNDEDDLLVSQKRQYPKMDKIFF